MSVPYQPKPVYPVPHRVGVIGMWLFLAALAMLFGASLTGYYFIRLGGADRPAAGSIHLPPALWISTAVILLSSYTVQRALNAVRLEKRKIFIQSLIATDILAIVFVLIQFPSLVQLLREHHVQSARYAAVERAHAPIVISALPSVPPPRVGPHPVGASLYGLVFFLILLHAMHVIGGIAFLVPVTRKALASGYDHEHYGGVRHVALYWHFLDVVWLVMFLSMWAVG